MPEMGGLSEHERQFLPEVEDVLVRAGFLPTRGGGEYRLEFRLSDGLVNADSFLRILSGDTEVAAAKARSGGVSTLFRRTRAVEESFHRCLADFESQLAGAAGGFREDRRPALPQAPVSGQEADWQRGW